MNNLIIALLSIIPLMIIIYLGLPRLLNALGLHPHYGIPEFDLTGKRALMISTSHNILGNTGKATGLFSSELTVPYYAFLDAKMTVDIASIKGGEIPIEPSSIKWPIATKQDIRFQDDSVAMGKLNTSIAITDIDASQYDVIFIAGGWGAAYDLAQSEALAKLVTKANANNSVIGSVCHGALGLVNAQNIDGSPLIKGRKVTGVTNKQLKQLGVSMTPLHPETELRSRGAIFEANSGFRDMLSTHVVVDGTLITGQNQNSGAQTAHQILALLAQK
jgi:putative intracellular protease/amidase